MDSAHVDHGKTTLVDCLLKQSGTTSDKTDRMMDSNTLEKERKSHFVMWIENNE
jgi:GTP-binding protein